VHRVDDAGHERLGAVVVEHLARPEQQRGHEDDHVQEPLGADHALDLVGGGDGVLAGQHADGQRTGQGGAHGVRADHQPTPVLAVGDDPGREREQQPREPLHTTPTIAMSSGLRVIADASQG
jgi:hypothetical protein